MRTLAVAVIAIALAACSTASSARSAASTSTFGGPVSDQCRAATKALVSQVGTPIMSVDPFRAPHVTDLLVASVQACDTGVIWTDGMEEAAPTATIADGTSQELVLDKVLLLGCQEAGALVKRKKDAGETPPTDPGNGQPSWASYYRACS